MAKEMIDKWAATLSDRQTVLQFFDWLNDQTGETPLTDLNIDKWLDQYHGIDRAQLDKERREVLNEARGLRT